MHSANFKKVILSLPGIIKLRELTNSLWKKSCFLPNASLSAGYCQGFCHTFVCTVKLSLASMLAKQMPQREEKRLYFP